MNTLGHWHAYVRAADAAGVKADRAKWSVSRSILATDSDQQARDYLATPDNSVRWDDGYLHHSMTAKKLLGIFKRMLDVPDADITVDNLIRDLVISGSPATVLDRLVAMVDEIGPIGGLMVAKKEFDAGGLQRRSLALLAEQVMPKLRAHVASLPRAA